MSCLMNNLVPRARVALQLRRVWEARVSQEVFGSKWWVEVRLAASLSKVYIVRLNQISPGLGSVGITGGVRWYTVGVGATGLSALAGGGVGTPREQRSRKAKVI